jgi:hypothetical protein
MMFAAVKGKKQTLTLSSLLKREAFPMLRKRAPALAACSTPQHRSQLLVRR